MMTEPLGRLRVSSRALRRAVGRSLGHGPLARRWRRMRPVRRLVSVALLCSVLALPVVTVASLYQDYYELRDLGTGAIHHLLAAKDDLLPSSGTVSSTCSLTGSATPRPSPTPTATATPGTSSGGGGSTGSFSVPGATQLAAANHELQLAQQQFGELIAIVNHPTPLLSAANRVPALGGKVGDIRQLLYVGNDVATMGISLLAAATPLLNRLHTGALSASGQPLVTAAEAAQLRTALVSSTGLLDDIEARISQVNFNGLPLNTCQRSELSYLTQKLPEVRGLLANAPQYFDVGMWLIGVDHQRQFLIQTLDRSELRPTGGFTGDYGVLQIAGGRVQPFTLRDINGVYLNTPYSYRPPAVYSWWPFMRWGLRDSNLSPDFPTTAGINIQLFEGIQHVWKTIGLQDPYLDGVVQFTTTPIAHVLQVTGPLTVPTFNVVVNAANVESKIHYYQNDPNAIGVEDAICPSSIVTLANKRKCFTTLLAHVLEAKARQLSFTQLFNLAELLVKDLQSHEIQLYFTNPQVENFLLQQGLAGRLNTTPGMDTLMIDQASVSVSKSSQFIQTTLQDSVTLDSKGGATHHLHFQLINQIGNQNNYSYIKTYTDYVRIYVPAGAQLMDANGFDTGEPVCFAGGKPPPRWAALQPCPIGPGFFPDQSLVCPPANWAPGPVQGRLGADGRTPMPVDNTGFPTSSTSDLPGLTMWGGYVTIPNGCTSNVTLTYYVPHVALPSSAVHAGAPGYTLLIERQAGTNIGLNIAIQPTKGVVGMSGAKVTFKGALDMDTTIVVPRTP